MINKDPITEVRGEDVGRRVTMMWLGMDKPKYGTVTGLATRVPDRFFVQFDGEKSKLCDTYLCRWGEVESWLEADNPGAVK